MSKQIEALKLALEALEGFEPKTFIGSDAELLCRAAITAIRKALADSALDRMAENARELGLDYEPIVEQVEDSVGMGHGAWDMVEPKKLAKAFHEALAEQPAQRTWVGLTHEDTYEATGTASTDLLDLAKLWSDNKVHVYQFDNEARKIIEAVLRRASAKLREKNNG